VDRPRANKQHCCPGRDAGFSVPRYGIVSIFLR